MEEFEPVFGNQVLWKLLTPVAFIHDMNSEESSSMLQPVRVLVQLKVTKPSFDITSLVFDSYEEFSNYVFSYGL